MTVIITVTIPKGLVVANVLEGGLGLQPQSLWTWTEASTVPACWPTPLMLPNNMVPPNISAPNLSRCHLCFSAAVDKRVVCTL